MSQRFKGLDEEMFANSADHPPRNLDELSDLELIEAVENEVENFKIDTAFTGRIGPTYERKPLLNKAIQRARVTAADSTLKENIILSLTGEERRAIATVACFLLVKGKPKVGKTNVVLWIVSVLLGKKGFPYDGHIPDCGEVLWGDTEQSRLHVAQLGSTIGKLFGLENFHPRLTLLSLRSYSPHARWHMIEFLIKSNDQIRVLVIDNLAELVGSVLDDKEANELFGKIIRLIEARKISVLAVLHTNKSNSNSRGFVGGLAEQFAECVWDVQRRDGVVYLDAKLTRNAPIPIIAYRFNDGAFEFIDAVKNTRPISAKKDFYKVPVNLHTQVLREIFNEQSEWSPSQFQVRLRAVYSQIVTPIGLDLVKKLQSYYVTQNMILKGVKKLSMTGTG